MSYAHDTKHVYNVFHEFLLHKVAVAFRFENLPLALHLPTQYTLLPQCDNFHNRTYSSDSCKPVNSEDSNYLIGYIDVIIDLQYTLSLTQK